MNRPRRQRGWQNSYLQNLVGGDYNPVSRLLRVAVNIGRRLPNHYCCGNYGEPGC